MRQNIFKGLGVALVTPFNQDGTIDYPSLKLIIENLIENNVDFLCVLGSTAETPCLKPEEKIEIKNFVVKTVAQRIPILLGLGSNFTQALVEEIKALDFSGIQGILSVVPYYNKPSQEGIYQHFSAVSQALPQGQSLVLYNVPGRSSINMEAETTLRLARDHQNIVAIKEASGKIEQIKDIINNAPQGFEVLSGDDSLTAQLIQLGAAGVISVVGNAIPRQFKQLISASLAGDTAQAQQLNQTFKDLYHLAFKDGNPAGIKALLSQKNQCKNILRLPLTPATEETQQQLKKLSF